MTYEQIATMIEAVGLPFAYHHFDTDDTPALPFIAFHYPARDDFSADNINYQQIVELNIELYTDNKDFQAEARLEAVLNQYGLFFLKDETYINNERMYQILYTTEVNING